MGERYNGWLGSCEPDSAGPAAVAADRVLLLELSQLADDGRAAPQAYLDADLDDCGRFALVGDRVADEGEDVLLLLGEVLDRWLAIRKLEYTFDFWSKCHSAVS
ncbi:hypothetical protein GCM10022207_92440 [Streptomyces lannensis]|uniref:Uncharacterized protein n=1 Tax=Streptomyces lannensis TaxID=766498 RepID=A0ABP7LWS2_9ACTN